MLSVPNLYKKQWRLFASIRQEDVVQDSSVVEGNWETSDFYTIQEKIIRVVKITDWQTNPIAEFRRLQTKFGIEMLKILCVIVLVIIWSVIILCSYK
jgi:hypothetical protein